MDAIDAIMTRRSVRFYTEKPINDGDMQTILQAGQAGPSCTDARDWAFLVVRDREMLGKMADINGRPGEPARRCAAAVLVCGDLDKAFKRAPEYWIIDGAIACQNMLLAAHALGIGSVWLGTYPQEERVSGQAELFGLPENLVPHSILAFGYGDVNAETPKKLPGPKPCFDETVVHYDRI